MSMQIRSMHARYRWGRRSRSRHTSSAILPNVLFTLRKCVFTCEQVVVKSPQCWRSGRRVSVVSYDLIQSAAVMGLGQSALPIITPASISSFRMRLRHVSRGGHGEDSSATVAERSQFMAEEILIEAMPALPWTVGSADCRRAPEISSSTVHRSFGRCSMCMSEEDWSARAMRQRTASSDHVEDGTCSTYIVGISGVAASPEGHM
jgi:hypothetical protein